MTNKSTSLTPVTSSTTNTNQSLTANSTKKILFCKSKAFFFKKIYKALQKIERPTVPTGEIGKLRASGKMLAQFMDKDCFTDSAIDEDQMYDLEFTVAIMELTTVKQGKALNLTRNFEVI